jgi:hypothetical protein
MTAAQPMVFPGTAEERDALLAAVRAACTCPEQAEVAAGRVCGAHALLLNQQILKRLIFYRRWQPALWPSEPAGRLG